MSPWVKGHWNLYQDKSAEVFLHCHVKKPFSDAPSKWYKIKKTRSLIMMKKLLLSVFLFVCLVGLIPAQTATEKDQKAIPDFSNQVRSTIPAEYTWNVADIYPSIDAWKADLTALSTELDKIDAIKEGWTTSAHKMLAYLKFAEQLQLKSGRVGSYISFLSDTDMGKTEYQALSGELQSINIRFGQKFASFSSDILALGSDQFAAFLKEEPGLAPYRMQIEDILRLKDHILPAEQQEIVSMTSLFSGVPSRTSSMLNNMELPPAEIKLKDGSSVRLNIANFMRLRSSADADDRSLVMTSFWQNQKRFEKTFAILFDGAMKQHLFSSKVRHYPDCLEAQLFPNAIGTPVYHQLIKSVHENLGVLHRYLKIKKQLLGLETYRYDDNYASSVKAINKRFSFAEAETLIRDAMKPLGKEYLDVLGRAFKERWIDIYPNQGKSSGAYSSNVYGVHPYMKLNYNGDYSSVSTAAHELGHSLHSFFSDMRQPMAMADYPIFLAEIASTFNENLLMDYMLKKEKDDLFKLYILDSYLDQVRSTIFRQTQFAEFELAMHQRVEAGQSLTADWLNKTYLDITRAYYGHEQGVCQVGEHIQSEWTGVPHFFYNFYVYQYSTGMIASMALADMVLQEGPKGAKRYLDFISAGGSDYPLETLKKAGVDMTRAESAQAAFNRLSELLGEMEKIIMRLNKK